MFDIIEQIIASHFRVSQRELLADQGRDASDARHFLWYVLHCVMGYSVKSVAKRYGVSPRNVLFYSAVVREGIMTQPFYATHYREIRKSLRMLDII